MDSRQPTAVQKKHNSLYSYQINTSNPNQCWQRSDLNSYRAPNKFENNEIMRMKNKQRYMGISQSIDSGGLNSARGLIKSQQSSIDRSSIQLKHQLNQALFESLKSGASQDDQTILQKTTNKLDL